MVIGNRPWLLILVLLTVISTGWLSLIPCDVYAGGDSPVAEKPREASQSDNETEPVWFPQLLGAQFNAIYQNVPDFNSPYSGQNSFRVDGGRGHDITTIYGVYLGSQITPSLQAYCDIEMAHGSGVSNGVGLGGGTNGDGIRTGTVDLGAKPYIARIFMRYLHPLSEEIAEVEKGVNQLPGKEPTHRVEAKVGLVSGADDFDQNRYANNTRTQFMNYSFINNPAWDYAANSRGYSWAMIAALVQPTWRLALGSYMEPTTANGYTMDEDYPRACGNNLELTVKPNENGFAIRFLSFINRARMGSYKDAVDLGGSTLNSPDVVADEKPGRTKYGFGINFEQPLSDKGETGIFGRLGWNDGRNETFNYTEVDQTASVGVQICGVNWGRTEDRIGLAVATNGLSNEHKNYLEKGGQGMMLGDGQLNYAPEGILEAYYRIQIGPYVQISPDFQYVQNPGYNQDRGPAEVYSLRFRVMF